jgi:competence protein ComEC
MWAMNIVFFSAVLQLGLLLPMVEIFHRVTFAGIALNALALPVMTVLLAVAVPTVVLSAALPSLALWAGKLAAPVLGALFFLTELPNMPAWLSYRVPDPPAWVAWGFALSMVVAAWALGQTTDLKAFATNGRWRLSGFAACAIAGAVFATLLCIHPFEPRLRRGILEVTALDCGGGDALLVVLPDRTTMLFGACGGRGGLNRGVAGRRRWDLGENVVSPYLWSRGLKSIDVLVLADAHADHMAGLSAVIENFHVGDFWQGEVTPTPAYEDLTQTLRQRGVRVRRVTAGEVGVHGSSSVQILWPPPSTLWSRNGSPDDADAVVARITGGESATALLPGDISSEAERKIVGSGTVLASRLLKVAHQGAKSYSSSEFLAKVSPEVALVSGQGSGSRSLPNPETLARLRSVGARVFRPDVDGTVMVEMAGSSFLVHAYGGSVWSNSCRRE